MVVRKTYTENAFKQAVALAKAEGHKFLGYTWNFSCFEDLMIERCY